MATVKSSEREHLENLTRLREEIERKHRKSVEQLYEEREKRIRDAIQMKEPDRVPVILRMNYFPSCYAGITKAAAYYDATAWKNAAIKAIVDFEPDLYMGGTMAEGGTVLEALDPKHRKWPGGSLPPDVPHQAVEPEYMKEDEYDLFLSDPTDFTLRYLLPRAFGALAPLSKLPSLTDRFTGFAGMTPIFTRSEFQQMAKIILKAGQEQEKWRSVADSLEDEAANLGFPPMSHAGGAGGAPFDAVSDFYRGMRGSMSDLFRCPDKILAACDMILKIRMSRATPADPKKRGNPKRVMLALHRGADGFMSKKQFEVFYWPGLKKAMQTSIDLGYIPIPFCEGRYATRLEHFLEMPKGKIICYLDLTDMARAKAILGDHVCIMGNVPVALLQIGSAQEVEEYCKNLIKVCGKSGGFVMTTGSSIDDAKLENVKAMVDSVKKHGWY